MKFGISFFILGIGCFVLFLADQGLGGIVPDRLIPTDELFTGEGLKHLEEMTGSARDCVPIPKDHHRCGPTKEFCFAHNGTFCPEEKRVKCVTKKLLDKVDPMVLNMFGPSKDKEGERTSCFCDGKGLIPADYGMVVYNLQVCDKDWYTAWQPKWVQWMKTHKDKLAKMKTRVHSWYEKDYEK